MNSKRLALCALVAFGSISLASCGDKPVEPEVEKATITVTNGTGSGTYTVGQTATIVADTIVGKTFKEWQVDNKTKSTLNPYTFTVTKSETYVAIFDITKVQIDVVGGEGSGTYNYGDTVSISPNVDYGYEFVSWLVNDKVVSAAPNYSFTAEKDLTITANIKEQEKVIVNVVGGTGAGTYILGSNVTVVANVGDDQEFVNWTVDGEIVSTNAFYTFVAEEDITLTAHVKSKEADKVVVTVDGGTGSGTYDIGATVTAVATVPAGKKFVNWTINDSEVSTELTYVFTVNTDTVLVANFEDIPEHKMAKYAKTVEMSGDDFKILNLTDIQLHDGDDYELNEHIISQVIERTQPDLITVLGDTINDDTTYSTKDMPKKIISLIDSYDIPWAPIFGNHDYIDYGPSGTKKYGGVAYLEELFAASKNCLYVHGPSSVRGSSNYIVNVVKEGTGTLVESLIFLDSHHAGLDGSNTVFYEDAIDYVTELNNDVAPRSIVFEHVPLPEYGTVFSEAEADEMHNISGVPFRDPITGTDTSLFPKIKELGSTKAVISGHDHELAFVAEYEGVNLVYALKSSLGNDPDGNSYSHLIGGLVLTLDGENDEKYVYEKVTDLPYEIVSGKDFPYFPEILQYWQYSGAKLKFDIELPASGELKFNLQGTNFRRDTSEDLQRGNWNRLTGNITINAASKSVDYGSLTHVDGDKYQFEVDLADLSLNTGSEKAYGDETARLVYFASATNNFKVNNIRFEKEEAPVTDQIDLSAAEIAPIADQIYIEGRSIRPEVTVTLGGQPLKLVDDILVKYSNDRAIGTATVEVVPSGKGAQRYKGSKTTTYKIVENSYRGVAFEPGYTLHFDDTSLEKTMVFDVHFTSANGSTMYFMIGDGWDEYFGYYGLNANGTLVEAYNGVSVAQTSDKYVRVTCVLSLMDKKNGSNPNPTEKVNMFYIHGSWGNNPKGFIDFDLSDAPEVVRGESFKSGEDKSIDCNFNYGDTVIIDFKFTSGAGTHVNFFIGNKADNWARYFGYFKVNQEGTLGGNYDGVSLTTTTDGYYRITLVLSELTLESKDGKPTAQEGFNLFYIRGGWTDGSGYVDFNPTV